MALTLQQVKPVDPRWIIRMAGLSPAGMDVPELLDRHAPLFAWRDALYEKRRLRRGAAEKSHFHAYSVPSAGARRADDGGELD